MVFLAVTAARGILGIHKCEAVNILPSEFCECTGRGGVADRLKALKTLYSDINLISVDSVDTAVQTESIAAFLASSMRWISSVQNNDTLAGETIFGGIFVRRFPFLAITITTFEDGFIVPKP